MWWPRISTQLDELVKNCTKCCKEQLQRAKPMSPSELPELPWQKVGTDLFEWDKHMFVLIVDYYSRFIEIARLSGESVISKTKSIFARHGLPETVISDNGPQKHTRILLRSTNSTTKQVAHIIRKVTEKLKELYAPSKDC